MANSDIAREFYDALNRHDLEAATALYDQRVEFMNPFDKGRSREARRATWNVVFDAAPDWHFEIRSLTSQGDRVCVEGAATATQAKPVETRHGMLEGGRLDQELAIVLTFRDGLIVRESSYTGARRVR